MNKHLFVGLMSGTSADGIDAALVEIKDNACQVQHFFEQPYTQELREDILSLCLPGDNEIERMGTLDRKLATEFAQATLSLLDAAGIPTSDITAIGSHGQTVRHRPTGSSEFPFTLQIGDPNVIAELTGIDTVADFRRRDMAAQGQGAPLAPAFHQAAFASTGAKRAIINIGGMANITVLTDTDVIGYDTGPGNALMDAWINQVQGHNYDLDGHWALGGQIIPALLQKMLDERYFALSYPKSTGRELFNKNWLQQHLDASGGGRAQDIQTTLMELTASSICAEVTKHQCDEIYICGGGALNIALIERIRQLCSIPVATTSALGIHPQQVEAAAFAWLAYRRIGGLTGSRCAVTGAHRDLPLGGVYLA